MATLSGARMPRLDQAYAGLGRLTGRTSGGVDQGIVIVSPCGGESARRRIVAAMSEAIMKGDVQGVIVALGLFGVQPQGEDGRRR